MNDKKMTKRNYSKNTLALLTVMVMLMATLFTACGSSREANTFATEDTTNVEVAKEEDSTETTETEEVAEVEPEVEEPTEELMPEPVVYEGIDMESTLPGLEWIETFNGVIDEPKLVIYNDETNRKIIVENDQKIEFSDNDILTFYCPKGDAVAIDEGQNDSSIFDEISYEGYFCICKGLFVGVKNKEEIPLRYVVSIGDTEYKLSVTLLPQKSDEVTEDFN